MAIREGGNGERMPGSYQELVRLSNVSALATPPRPASPVPGAGRAGRIHQQEIDLPLLPVHPRDLDPDAVAEAETSAAPLAHELEGVLAELVVVVGEGADVDQAFHEERVQQDKRPKRGDAAEDRKSVV